MKHNAHVLPPEFDLPAPLSGLAELATNVRWAWNADAQAIFNEINPAFSTRAMPPAVLLRDRARLDALAKDSKFVKRVNAAVEDLRAAVAPESDKPKKLIAYFCAEYALHESFPQYSGGLGILAGDHLKEASDRHLNLVAVGLFYRRGFFSQRLDGAGRQEHLYPTLDAADCPVQQVLDPKTKTPLRIHVPIGERTVAAAVWLVQVGRTPLILLDTDVPENSPEDRPITSQLYTSGRDMRLHQEAILGIGGKMVLDALGIQPTTWHLNEGHSAFLIFERLRQLVNEGKKLEDARRIVRESSIITIHTPVAAGNERFDTVAVTALIGPSCKANKIPINRILKLGLDSEDTAGVFDMTAFALRHCRSSNGVSLLHGRTADKTWRKIAGHPVLGVTNGVHMPTWLGPELLNLVGGPGDVVPAVPKEDDFALEHRRRFTGIRAVQDEALWRAHQTQKQRLIEFARARMFEQRARQGAGPAELRAVASAMNPEAFTIGFARRFATYKRAHLIFSNLKRLVKLLNNADRPVQIVIAGKAHPADRDGQSLIAGVFERTMSDALRDKVFVIEDYDMALGRHLVQGVDIWLNNPRRPLEASGTSGMKAAANGIPNVSILDGWWDEACDEGAKTRNGWAIGNRKMDKSEKAQDKKDAGSLYTILEGEVVPMFFDRDASGVPSEWVQVMKASISDSLWAFSCGRMLADYDEMMYG
jgi:starch phosphorylase